jgi:APA family basic amino acid/polyamine antiporter
MLGKQLFAKKSLSVLLDEMAGEHRLRRVLGPIALSSLGIGAIIGTGIFVLTGIAARQHAGPGLILSFVLAGTACAFAALCYAEFASMAPVAGSAYTYAYVSLGELIAWIIGWDLVLEYAMASATVANGWAHYLLALLRSEAVRKFAAIPMWLMIDPFNAATQHTDYLTAENLSVASITATPWGETGKVALPVVRERVDNVEVEFTPASVAALHQLHGQEAAEASILRVRHLLEQKYQYEPNTDPAEMLDRLREGNLDGYEAYENTPFQFGPLHLTCNLLAIFIVTAITIVLVIGIRESAGFNAAMVMVKIVAVLFVIGVGSYFIDPSHWRPFLPYGWKGVADGAALIFFAYIGFDSVSTHAEEAKNPARDVPIGILASLAVCTVLYIAVAAVVTGMVPYPDIPLDAPIAGVFAQKGIHIAGAIITVGALTGITSVLLVMLLSQPRVLLAMARDGLLPKSFFGAVHPRFRTPHRATILSGVIVGLTASLFPLEAMSHMVNIGTLFAFVVVCASVWLMRWVSPQANRPFRTPLLHIVAPSGIVLCLYLMYHLDWQNWVRLAVWLAAGLLIYFFYGRHHSTLGKELRGAISHHGVSPAGVPLDGAPPA